MIEVKTNRPIIYQGDLSELESFIAEDGFEYFYSADGEHFYNAKGEKVKGFFKKVGGGFKKVGGGIVKGAKAIGRVIKKASVAVVKASKNVATGVKKVSGKRKKGTTKLIHHKKKASIGTQQPRQKFGSRNTPQPDLSKGPLAGLKDIGKGILGKGNKGPQPQPIPGMPAGLAGLGLSPSQAAIYGKSGKSPNVNPDGTVDVFSLPLKKITTAEAKNMNAKDIVEVNGQQYSAEGIEPGKEVVVTTDEETGQELVTIQYEPDEVVAVTGNDGNTEYVKKDDVKGMSKGLKYTLIIGGSVIALGLIGLIVYQVSKKNK
jgi:hypothetical protein